MKYIPTTEKVTVDNYPYGGLRTTLYDTMEFNPKKGYRHVTQTVNPKTNRINNPKKSTYYDLMVRYYDENGHIKTTVIGAVRDGVKGLNKISEFMNANFNLFSREEIEYIYLLVLSSIKLSMYGYMQYSGSKLDDLKPLFERAIKNMTLGLKDTSINQFGFRIDEEAVESTKVEGYNPFRIVTHD
jgi:hypothetical protein